MSVRARGARERKDVSNPLSFGQAHCEAAGPRLVLTRPIPDSSAGEGYSSVDLGESVRVTLMLVPRGRGSLNEQAQEVLLAQCEILKRQRHRMTVTSQTVFLRDPADLKAAEQLLSEHYGPHPPATTFVFQAPCCGAALAMEVWAIGGAGARVEHHAPHTLSVSYNGTRWIYCSGIRPNLPGQPVYASAHEVLEKMRTALVEAGSGFEHVVRTWFYLGAITQAEAGTQRYMELNRARAAFYHNVQFHCSLADANIPHGIYPASTAIGMSGTDLVAGCLALETTRPDAFLLTLENPQQTPAYAYHPRFSPQSPKFSRGVALVLGDYITTWVSGTASVVHSLSMHQGDIKKQTEQTIENIEKLIAAENFAFHGIKHGGSRLNDLAKIRVYLKRPEDFAECKAICEKRFGSVPAIYAVANVCRPELLIEIEGVAFSKKAQGQ